LVNPHITKDSYVISSQFSPGSPEVHHAVLSLVPPSMTAQAMAANAATGGKGWTCFGAPSLPDASLAAFLSTPFLSVWAPGHGADVLPKGTGIALPQGSLVIEQVHYNLLVGDKPVTNGLVLRTVPVSTPLLPNTARDQQADMAALGCGVGDVLGALHDQPVYPVPMHQSMPRQERRR